ncbi:MAG: Bcr/CflA family drug resistance efflux transporter [Planctomycetota bacterium]|nr:MAG: Bcr/CflA family drug resistance efflux transporter [Planctomycetota bacterium]
MITKKKKLPFGEFVILMAMMTSILALAIDCMLPAFNVMTVDLHLNDPKDIQLIVSFMFLGLGVGKLFFGSITDGYGRRPAVVIGFSIYLVGCLVSLFSENLTTMLIGRLLQGFGVAGPANVSLVLARDLYKGREMARIMSYIMMVFIMVPVLAPGIGLIILQFSNWRFIFIVFLVAGSAVLVWFLLRQEETLNKEDRLKMSISSIFKAFIEVCKIRIALLYTIVIGLTSGAFLAYLKTSQVIFEVQYGLGKMFPIYFGGLAIAVGVASFVNGRIVRKYGMSFLSRWALIVIVLSSFFLLLISYPYSGHPPLTILLGFLMVKFFCMGIIFGNLSSIAMEPVGHIAGMGAAVIGSLSTIISVPIGIFIGYQYDGNIYSLIIGFGACCLLSLMLIKLFDHENLNWLQRDEIKTIVD